MLLMVPGATCQYGRETACGLASRNTATTSGSRDTVDMVRAGQWEMQWVMLPPRGSRRCTSRTDREVKAGKFHEVCEKGRPPFRDQGRGYQLEGNPGPGMPSILVFLVRP